MAKLWLSVAQDSEKIENKKRKTEHNMITILFENKNQSLGHPLHVAPEHIHGYMYIIQPPQGSLFILFYFVLFIYFFFGGGGWYASFLELHIPSTDMLRTHSVTLQFFT